jgi:hypothetical protein
VPIQNAAISPLLCTRQVCACHTKGFSRWKRGREQIRYVNGCVGLCVCVVCECKEREFVWLDVFVWLDGCWL